MKNMFSTLRTAVLLFMLVGSVSFATAQSDFWHKGLKYHVTGSGTVQVIDCDQSIKSVVIPSSLLLEINYYDNYYVSYIVTSIASNAFTFHTSLNSIELPNTVTYIGQSAFYGCSALTDITLSNTLNSIGEYAFGYCTSLKTIYIPNSVTTMGWNVFYGCTALTDVSLSNHLRELNGTFDGCTSLESVRIPNSVVSLNSTFSNCTSLYMMAIPNSVSSIGEKTFMGCSGLKSVNIPNSVTKIGNQAFSNTGLTSVVIPNTVTNLGVNAFEGCLELTSVTSCPVEPPMMSAQNTFDVWIYENAKLKVPLIAVTTYKDRNWWKLFQDVIGDELLNNTYDFVADGIYYNKVDDNSVEITFKDNNYNSYSGTVTVPASVTNDGRTYSVTGIGNYAFYNCQSLIGVTLPASITSIGSYAFANAGLTTLNLPGAVTTIATRAFYGCTKLSSLTIPNNVTSIGKEAFAGCDWLTQLAWNARHCWTNGDLTTNNITKVSIGNNVEILPDGFVSQSKVSSIIIPASVTTIGCNAFYGCSLISSITIPKSISIIGTSAFSGCTGLTELIWNAKDCLNNGDMCTEHITHATIGNEVETLPIGFLKNSQISTINLPNSVKRIGPSSFYGCHKLSELLLPESIRIIDDDAFYGCNALVSLTIPRSVISIGSHVFDACDGITTLNWNAINCGTNGDLLTQNLAQINIGNEVKKIPINFAKQSKITSVTIPNSVDSICSNAFAYCYELSSIIIPNSVTEIGRYAFSSCTGLKNITLGASVERIDWYAFYGCTGLTSLVIPDNVKAIDWYAFSGCTSIKELTWNAKRCSSNGNMTTANIDRVSIGEDVEVLPSYFVQDSKITEVTIPNAVTSIGSSAFSGCTGLTEITIPNAVTSIGNAAFQGCTGLTEITIPNAVISIGYSAFSGCTGLKTLNFNAENCSNFNNNQNHPFYNCPIERIVIGENVKTIPGNFAYNLIGLTEVTIADAVTSIGNSAFSGCSGLESVTCWALEPPRLGYSAFNGVPSNMRVYVPAIAFDAYEGASGWNQFIILPMDDYHKTLSVSLPENVDVQDYANMRLEVNNIENNQTLCFTLTDKSSYKFTVEPNSTWNVTLTNQYGDLFGKIEHVEVGEENVSVTFSSLLKPQDVSLTVKKPNGQEVTAACKISWFDEDGELLLQGNPIKKLPVGRKLKYQVTLPQDLATAFTLPSTNTYTVKDGNNEISCQLSAISEAQLSGRVKDATNNQSLYGATISAVQSFGGGITKTIIARTDNQGQYSLEASTVPTTLTIAATGYISQTIDCDMTSSGSTVTVPDVALSPITGVVVNINLTYTPAHAEGEADETQNWYSDYSNVDYEVYNITTGHAITDISVQYPQIVLIEDVGDGDVLELTATSRKNAFKPVKTTVTVAEQKATATFNIKELGKVTATFNRSINPKVTGTLYDAENKLVKTADYSGSTQTIEELPDGNYQLVTMGKSDFFNSVYDLDQFAAAGLTEGDDFVKNEVQINSGIISLVSIDEVPFFDESKFYYTGENTSFSVNKPNIVVGNYLTFRAKLDFKEQYANQVNDVQLIVDLPESCSFLDNSVMAGANMADYITIGNRITIPLANWNDVVVRFCAIPTMPGDFSPSAFVRFKLNGKTITQPIGNAPFKADGLSINVPTMVANTEIPVSGTVIGVCNIDIYDNDVLIAQTTSLANGTWSTICELHKAYNFSFHNIYAVATTKDGFELRTETANCWYNKNQIKTDNVAMLYYNPEKGQYNIVFDFINGTVTPSYYYFFPYNYWGDSEPEPKDFTFVADLANKDTTIVENVIIKVFTESRNWKTLRATYDSNIDKWVASSKFGESDLPVSVKVDCTSQGDYDYSEAHQHDIQDVVDILEDCYNKSINDFDVSTFDINDNGFSYYIKSEESTDSILCIVRLLDYEVVQQLMREEQFYLSPETSQAYFYQENEGAASSIYVDMETNLAFELTTSSNNMNNLIIKGPAGTLYGIANFLINFKDYWDFIGHERFAYELLRLAEMRLQNAKKSIERLKNLKNAKCPDGSYALSDNMRNALQSDINRLSNRFNDTKNKIEDFMHRHNSNLYDMAQLIASQTAISFVLGKGLDEILSNYNLANSGIGRWLQRYSGFQQDWINDYLTNSLGFAFDHLVLELPGIIYDLDETLSNVENDFIEYLQDFELGMINEAREILDLAKQASRCPIDEDDEDEDDDPHPIITPIHEPSGFVYEGVPSNRLQGVTATCYYKETVEGMYGDIIENVVLWDAENYGQENPLITDENGYYRWDVPIGMWQVKYEKEGYETTFSDWLPVPPPQLDVNIGMVQMRQPEVIKARAYPKAVEFEFDKFMFPETLNSDNITVTVNGSPVSGTIELLNAEVDDPLAITSIRRAPGTGLTFASRVRFNANSPFNADKVTLHVNKDVKSYADLEMYEDYEAVLDVELEIQSIEADSTVNILYGDSRELTVTVLPANASRGKTLSVRSVAPMITTTDAETYTLNNNGQAIITVHGDLPGMTSLLYSIDGYDLTASTLVNVMSESQMTVATPTASIASGSEVEKGTAVYLSCSTEGATIYYTLDGSCPCDNTPARKVYDGTPIIINSTTTIKAMATAPDLYDSDVATFVYRVPNGLRGDVNGDGEVNIADVNALLDIVLGGQVDEDTRARADVNADDEVNIADINAVIELILNPSNHVMNKVNCNDLLHIDDVTIKPGDIKTINVTIDNASRYSAMQCDIVLPAGLTLLDILSVNGHINKTDELDENTMRAVNYSMDKRSYSGDGSPVMSLTVLADADLGTESEFKLTNVVLADAANKAWRVVDCTARISNTTGINDLTASIDRVWVEGNTLCIETRQDGVASIAAINGVTYDLDVKAGVNRYVLDTGLYVVVINGKGHKIAVK